MEFHFALADEGPRGTRRKAADVRLQAVRLMTQTQRPQPDNSPPEEVSGESRKLRVSAGPEGSLRGPVERTEPKALDLGCKL
jgi:hypothetical protein